VVYFEIHHSWGIREELFIAMPNIESLRLREVVLLDGFMQPDKAGPNANTKLFPSLRFLHLENTSPGDSTLWRPLVDYLVHQTSNRQAISLEMSARESHFELPWEVAKEIAGLAENFTLLPAYS
jgi:hypothetical protein